MRLKLFDVCDAGLLVIFQFHKGAIETLLPSDVHVESRDFQFHKGAIETSEKQQEKRN